MRSIGWIVLAGTIALATCAGEGPVSRAEAEMPYASTDKPALGDIYHVPTGLKVPFEGAMEMVAGATLVCVGETHDNIHAHEVELAVIRNLARRFPGGIAIGMEMFRKPQQGALDRWTRGELTELQFLKESRWYDNWGSDFGYYRDILLFAKEHRIDVVALDPSKELEKEASETGLENLPETVRRDLPTVEEGDPYERELLRAVYDAHVHSPGSFESFFRVQMLWEETMAARITDYLASPRGRGKKMVTITGGWHVRYGFGVPKKVIRRRPMPYAIVLPEEIDVPKDMQDRLMNVKVPAIPLLPADFVWYVPYEALDAKRVRMGVGLSEEGKRVVVRSVTEGSPAQKAGVRAGDVLLSIDGRPVTDVTDVLFLMERKKEGDRVALVLRRARAEIPVEVTLVRLPKAKGR